MSKVKGRFLIHLDGKRLKSKNPPSLDAGLTLVETMIVVCILALIVAVALPNFLRAREEASAKLCVAKLRQMETAKERWAWSSGAGLATEVYMSDLVSDFIKIAPVCPSEGEYTLGTVSENPTCSIGTNDSEDLFDDHELPY